MSNRLQAKSPSTPTSQPQIKPETIPGTWRHPHLDEVTRRLNKSTFNEKNFRAIVISTALLVASFSYPQFIGHLYVQEEFTLAIKLTFTVLHETKSFAYSRTTFTICYYFYDFSSWPKLSTLSLL